MTLVWRESLEVEALRTDRYLEGLLSGTERPGSGPDAGLVATAARLRRDLTRVHPSFRFEERLARRLGDVAAAMRLPTAAGAEGVSWPVLPFPIVPDVDPADIDDPDDEPGPSVSRPVLIGGAVASAALSLAGAALVAWRLGRASADPAGRVIRLADDPRLGGRPVGRDTE
jgi:hypothetical protein